MKSRICCCIAIYIACQATIKAILVTLKREKEVNCLAGRLIEKRAEPPEEYITIFTCQQICKRPAYQFIRISFQHGCKGTVATFNNTVTVQCQVTCRRIMVKSGKFITGFFNLLLGAKQFFVLKF